MARQQGVINPNCVSKLFKSLHFAMSVAIIGKHTLNAGFHCRRSHNRGRNQKCKTIQSGENHCKGVGRTLIPVRGLPYGKDWSCLLEIKKKKKNLGGARSFSCGRFSFLSTPKELPILRENKKAVDF